MWRRSDGGCSIRCTMAGAKARGMMSGRRRLSEEMGRIMRDGAEG
jgi:hypothetical protein